MISIFDFNNYRAYLHHWLEEARKSIKSGLKSRFAEAVQISPAMVSLILKGDKNMSMEQAAEAAEFLNLNDLETDYFLLLVEAGRAGSFKLQRKLGRRLREMQLQAKKIASRVKKDKDLSDEEKAIYYSNWTFAGVRNLSAIGKYNTPDRIAARLGLPVAQVLRVVDFLVDHGLLKNEGGSLSYGPAHIFVGADSPFVARHHQNWRLQGFRHMEQLTESNLFYTCPMSLSAEAVEKIRKLLPNTIEQVNKIAGPSESERAYCLNIDWFEF
jgi:uncharacterized protein (TIGR02147 family)